MEAREREGVPPPMEDEGLDDRGRVVEGHGRRDRLNVQGELLEK